MRSLVATSLLALLFVLPLPLGTASAAVAQDGNCVSSREAQQAVEAGEVLGLADAASRQGEGQKYIGEEARLCDIDGAPHWVVNMMNEQGESERIVLNAQGN